MAFNFPVTPALNATHTEFGVTYVWNGEIWVQGSSAAVASPYVLKAGDAMTGVLSLIDPDPVAPVQATHKKYVDRLIAEMSLYQGTWQVAQNVPDLNVPPNAPLNGYSWIAQTADPNVPEMAPLTIPGIGGQMVAALDTVKWSEANAEYELIQGAVSISQMTIADTPPTGGFHGQCWWDSDSGKQYVYYDDGNTQQWVQMSGGGGTVFGDAPMDTQLYGRQSSAVDVIPAWVPIAVNATIISDTAPTNPGIAQLWWHSATGTLNIWFDDGTSQQWTQTNIEEAPVDGNKYVRQDAAWVLA
jgi:hypothetical protein